MNSGSEGDDQAQCMSCVKCPCHALSGIAQLSFSLLTMASTGSEGEGDDHAAAYLV